MSRQQNLERMIQEADRTLIVVDDQGDVVGTLSQARAKRFELHVGQHVERLWLWHDKRNDSDHVLRADMPMDETDRALFVLDDDDEWTPDKLPRVAELEREIAELRAAAKKRSKR